MKGFYESKESTELDKENSITNNKQKSEEFSQIHLDVKDSTEDNKAPAEEIPKGERTNQVENSLKNQQQENQDESLQKSMRYETLDESYSETFVNFLIILEKRFL
jgi:hypothetical protein